MSELTMHELTLDKYYKSIEKLLNNHSTILNYLNNINIPQRFIKLNDELNLYIKLPKNEVDFVCKDQIFNNIYNLQYFYNEKNIELQEEIYQYDKELEKLLREEEKYKSILYELKHGNLGIEEKIEKLKLLFKFNEKQKVLLKKDKEINNKLQTIINGGKNKKIKKNLLLTCNVYFNKNFLDDYLVEQLVNHYIDDLLNEKYNSYSLNNILKEVNNESKLFIYEIRNNDKLIYEYFLIINVFCINITLKNNCNLTMKNLISKILLSGSFTKELNDEQRNLDITERELREAFEYFEYNDYNVENPVSSDFKVDVESLLNKIDSKIEELKIEENETEELDIEENTNCLSKENRNELNKMINLFNNYEIVKDDKNFINSYAFNILLLGNDNYEKSYIVNYIKNMFNKKFNTTFFEMDIESEVIFDTTVDEKLILFKEFEKKVEKSINNNTTIFIKKFNLIEKNGINVFLKFLLKIIKNNKNIKLLISGEEEETLKMLNNNKEVYDLFSYRFVFKDYDIDELYELLISKINKTNYVMSFDKNESKKIINSLYRRSKYKNEEFVNRLYTDMFKNLLENNLNEFNQSVFPIVDDNDGIAKAIDSLNNLVGLKNVKKQVNKLILFWKFKKKINNNYETISSQYLNMYFTGNPGTGKTTVAKIISKILFELGYIKEDKFIEVTPNEMIADYVGQTKTKTKEILDRAQNGLLFVDEAYLFLNEDSFFNEALVELLKYMENPKNVVIFAGYSESMNKVLNINSGLKSRVSIFLNFDDYNIDELMQILTKNIVKNKFYITDAALEKVMVIIEKQMKERNFGNARYIEKLWTQILMQHAENFDTKKINNIMLIEEEDINEEEILNNAIKNKNSFGFVIKNGDV